MLKRLRAAREERERTQAWEIERKLVWTLKNCLEALGDFPEGIDGFEYAVNFFNTVADFRQNVRCFRNAPDTVREFQTELNRMLYDFGTSGSANFNRAPEGEKASLENTYWGGIFGIFTQTARYWMETDSVYPDFAKQWLRKPEPEDEETTAAYQEMLSPPVYKVIIDFQVRPAIKNAYEKMRKLCDVLLSAE